MAAMTARPFDIDVFLARPLVARVATNGPTIRPVWFLWEEQAFWILTGPWTKLHDRIQRDPEVAILVDVCELQHGLVRQVVAHGSAELLPFDTDRGRRKLERYLGTDESVWDERFRRYLYTDPSEIGTVWLHLVPRTLRAIDLSYQTAAIP
jgi:nitroimidazol reductase NimA-like FMN-containing flavoprotein (pyridoxamine 5'-phosphate oxidase superfamily)